MKAETETDSSSAYVLPVDEVTSDDTLTGAPVSAEDQGETALSDQEKTSEPFVEDGGKETEDSPAELPDEEKDVNVSPVPENEKEGTEELMADLPEKDEGAGGDDLHGGRPGGARPCA